MSFLDETGLSYFYSQMKEKFARIDSGTAIASGADLNNYTNIGTYYVADSTVATNITNTPTTSSGYKLIVMQVTVYTTFKIQLVICNHMNAYIYIRRYANNSWNNWVRFFNSESDTFFNLSLGTEIASGSNLNNYDTPGSYYVASGSVAANITNSPISNMGYKLIIFSLNASSYIMQMVFAYNGQIMRRTYNQNGWSNWYKISETVQK